MKQLSVRNQQRRYPVATREARTAAKVLMDELLNFSNIYWMLDGLNGNTGSNVDLYGVIRLENDDVPRMLQFH